MESLPSHPKVTNVLNRYHISNIYKYIPTNINRFSFYEKIVEIVVIMVDNNSYYTLFRLFI